MVSKNREHRVCDGSSVASSPGIFIVQHVQSMDGFGLKTMLFTVAPFLLPMAITRIKFIELSYVRHCAQSSKCSNSFNPHDSSRKEAQLSLVYRYGNCGLESYETCQKSH